ncbi:MAG: lytic transglycosylase domain-containing protein [Lysobacter sp.]|nr:lytic transglycosylase domain-containing protein [Lysobacter sp.]
MKGTVKLLCVLVCALAAAPAMAGSVYRCDSADGGRSYASKRVSGAKCTAVSSYNNRRSASSKASSTAQAANALTEVKAGGTSDAGAPATFMITSAPSAAPAPAPVRVASAPSRRVQGEVYSYVKDGVRHYTSKRPANVGRATAVRTIAYSYLESCFACSAKPGVNFGNVRLNTAAYRDEIAAAAGRHGVDQAIVRAIIHAESAFNPNALSRVGAQGLMQLMPATARRFGVTNSFDAAQNIGGGVEYLAWLLKRFDGNLTLAAAGYNAGEGAVAKYKGVPPYSETQRYVQRVGLLADRYRAAKL